MKKLIVFALLFISTEYCHSQNGQSKKGIKSINTTELFRQLYSDGKYYTSTIETNKTLYNEKGEKIKNIRITFENSEPKSKNTTTYYHKDNKIDFAISNINDDSISFKTYYNYNDSLLIKIHFNYIKDEKELSFEETYNYDNHYKLTSSNYVYYEKYIDSDTDNYITYLKLKEKYDSKERTTEMDYSESDSIFEHNKFSYKWKKDGTLLNKKEFDKKDKLINKTRYKYIFNEKNFWIVRKSFMNKSLHKIIYREFEYFHE